MKKNLKTILRPVLLVLLLGVLTALIIVPVNADSAYPGYIGKGPGGIWACHCPSYPFNCICQFPER